MVKKIEIIIKPDGQIIIDAVHFTGSACEVPIKELIKGFQVIHDKKKPEYFVRSIQTVNA